MADVEIKKKPDVKPTVAAPVRGRGGERSLTVKWNPGQWYKSGKNEARCEGWQIEFYLYCRRHSNRKKTKTLHYIVQSSDPNRKEWTLWFSSFTCGKTKYTRDSFYPNTDWEVTSVKATVRGKNRKGLGPWVAATCSFAKPRTPSITMEQDAETGDVRFKVKHNKGEDMKELWNTRVWHEVWDSSKAKGSQQIESGVNYFGTGETEHTYSCDVYGRMGKTYDQYTRVTVKATDRGMWGDGDTVSKSLYISWPKQPTVSLGAIAGRDVMDKVTVNVNLNKTTEHPVTGVRLEKLVNVSYDSAGQIPGDADWQECGAVDDGQCTALSSTVAELMPDPGKRSFVRVKTWNQIESIFYIYSKPLRLKPLETDAPTAADDTVKIVDARSGDDGESVVVTIAWNNDDSDGTEVSWSENKRAWRSAVAPEAFDVTYDDGEVTEGEGSSAVTWPHSAEFDIPDLEQGTPVYVRARRYMEGEDGRSWGPYYPEEGDLFVTPTTSPTAATLVAPASVPRGQSLAVSWSYDGGGEQAWWELLSGEVAEVTEEGVTRLVLDGETVVVARGEDALGACVVDATRVEGLLAQDGTMALAVRLSTGGTPVTSDALLVKVDDPPSVAVGADAVTAQPMALDVSCSAEATLSVVVRSAGCSVDRPDGRDEQAEGEQVWSAALVPDWDGSQGDWGTTVTAPEGLPLADGATYLVRVVATDPDTGLESEPAECEVAVDYARKAPEPSEAIAVTPYDETDQDSGIRTRGCTIELAAPDGAAETDVYDVYRVTPDGARPLALGLALDAVLDDPYAPFGDEAELAYLVSCRTADGCEETARYPYALAGEDLRVDFEGRHGPSYVELPYNLVGSDSWEKGFEARKHLDGSVGGYWEPGVVRKASLSTDLIRVEDEQTKRAVMELGACAVACWVRTPVGQAYEADVQVRSYGTIDYESAALPVALDVTEVTRTGFGATVAPTDEDGETEPDDQEEETEPEEE